MSCYWEVDMLFKTIPDLFQMSRASEPIVTFTDGSGIAKSPLRSSDNHCFTQQFQEEHPLTVEFGEDIAEFTIAGLRLSLEFSIPFTKSANLIYIQLMICKSYINTGYVVHIIQLCSSHL